MRKIRCGVVGLRHGMASVLEVVKEPAFELVALAARTSETYEYLCGKPLPAHLDSVTFTAPREQLIAECRSLLEFREVAFYADLEDFLRHPELEAVILAVPIHLNAPYALKALAAGKHVLAAKPFAHALAEGAALRRAAIEAHSKFMVNFEFRHAPLTLAIQRELEAGRIGALRLMWWNMFRMPFRERYRRREVSGGAYVAEVCHWFDLFHLWNGASPFARIAAFGGLDVHGAVQDFQDNAVCIIEYANGVRATVNFTYFTDQPEHNTFGLVGTRGKIGGDTEQAGRFVMYSGPDQRRSEFVADPATSHHGHLGFDVAHRRFAEVILEDRRVNEDEAARGFENLVISLAAQAALDRGVIVERGAFLAETPA